jgi:uncharacterized membrane protein YedE/YeeE
MEFVPLDAIRGLLGGVLIGCAAALLLLANGRIAGISGIAAVLVGANQGAQRFENLAFLGGLIAAPLIYAAILTRPEIEISTNPVLLVLAGLFVGFGTRLGSGCTSGHGVCGLSRFSTRSLSSVLIFMGTAMIVASGIGMMTGTAT